MSETLECPNCHTSGLPIWGCQYEGTSQDWDGVSEWKCMSCGTRWGRWSKRILGEGEIEGRYGRGTPIIEMRHSGGRRP